VRVVLKNLTRPLYGAYEDGKEKALIGCDLAPGGLLGYSRGGVHLSFLEK